MALKQIYQWLGFHNEPAYFLLRAFLISFLCMVVASKIFPESMGIVSVFLISIALMPDISRMVALTEKLGGKQKLITKKFTKVHLTEITAKANIGLASTIKDHLPTFKAYLFSFLGVFLAFMALTLFLPTADIGKVFGNEFTILAGETTGQAITSIGMASAGNLSDAEFFFGVLANNLGVLVVVFLLSLIYLYGSTFVIVWNAAIWGTVFAVQAKAIALQAGVNPAIQLAIIMAIVFPHLIAEAAAYFTAALAGGLTSIGIAKEKMLSDRMYEIMLQAIILIGLAGVLLIAAALIETFFPAYAGSLLA